MFYCCATCADRRGSRVPQYFFRILLAVLVGFIPDILMRRRLSPATTTAILAFRHECHRLGHHLVLAALLPVLRFPPALLQPPIDDDPTPLAKILSAMFRLLAEDDNVDKTDFLF